MSEELVISGIIIIIFFVTFIWFVTRMEDDDDFSKLSSNKDSISQIRENLRKIDGIEVFPDFNDKDEYKEALQTKRKEDRAKAERLLKKGGLKNILKAIQKLDKIENSIGTKETIVKGNYLFDIDDGEEITVYDEFDINDFEEERKVSKLKTAAKEKLARELERKLRFKEAIKIWEGLDNHEKAKDLRKKIINLRKAKQTIVQRNQITKNEFKDSVINKSNVGGSGSSKAEELREAKSLLDEGVIDDEEFKQMKKEILGK